MIESPKLQRPLEAERAEWEQAVRQREQAVHQREQAVYQREQAVYQLEREQAERR
jgi:hypothetical protein